MASEPEKCTQNSVALSAAENTKQSSLFCKRGIKMEKFEKSFELVLLKTKHSVFFYEDNLDLLRAMGAELVPFSPIHDAHLPENLDGLLLYGGYRS